MFAALSTRNFRFYISAQAASMTGLWIQRVAQDWLVLQLTGSPADVGIATAMQFVPTLILGLPAGMLADRVNRHRLLIMTRSMLGVCAAALGVLAVTGEVRYWHVLAVAFATGAAAAIDNPAAQAFVHQMVGPKRLTNAISLNSAVSQLGTLVGPSISVGLITLVGIGWSFFGSATAYVFVGIAMAGIRRSELGRTVSAKGTNGRMRAALVAIIRRPELRWPIALSGVAGFFTTNFPVSLAAFAKDFDLTAAGYGYLTVSLAAGSLIGALLAARRANSRLRTVVTLTLAVGLSQILAGFMPEMISVGLAMAVVGFMTLPLRITLNTASQLAADDEMRGRVMGVFMLMVLGFAAAGGPVIGYLAEWGGAPMGLFAGGIVMALAAVFVGWRLTKSSGVPVRDEVRETLIRARPQRMLRKV